MEHYILSRTHPRKVLYVVADVAAVKDGLSLCNATACGRDVGIERTELRRFWHTLKSDEAFVRDYVHLLFDAPEEDWNS